MAMHDLREEDIDMAGYLKKSDGGSGMNLKNKSVLVTGGAGFIGSHLVDALITKMKIREGLCT